MEVEHLECFQSAKTDSLWQACGATNDPAYDDLPVWGAIINMTATCMPYTAAVANQSAHGTFWAIASQPDFVAYLDRFNRATGLTVGFQSLDMSEYVRDRMPVWPSASDPGAMDFWMIGAEVFGEGIKRNAFQDLTFLFDREGHYEYTDIPAPWRSAISSAFAGAYAALPYMVLPWPLLYRRDLFDVYGIAVPQTWDDVLAVAERYGGGKLGPSQPDLAFCFESNVVCGVTQMALSYILASIVQLRGSSEGTWFDPEDLQPLYTTEAIREALRIFTGLKRHSINDRTPCQAVYGMLASGRCLMLWGFSFAFKRGSSASGPLRGRQGVASVPGSARVLDRPTGRLVACTPDRCPHATPAYTSSTAPANASYVPASTPEAVAATAAAAPLVNRVIPLGSLSFAINAFAPLPRQAAAFALLHTFTTPGERLPMVLSPTSDLVPMRFSELDESLWINAGYEPGDVRSFLAASRESLNHPNVFFELRIPGAFDLYGMMQTLVQRAVWGNYSHDEMVSYMSTATRDIVQRMGGKEYLLPLYRKSIGYTPPAAEESEAGDDSRRRRQHVVVLVSALVPSVALVLLAAVALWGYARLSRLRWEARTALRAAPGAGPATTLLVTDIQDSTCLWEALPAEVMDAAVKLHHRTIRELLLPYRGYESATEGDSFILAFEKPDRALSFSLAAQEALLRADWPPLLTASQYAATLAVSCDAAACSTVMPYIAPSRLRDALTALLAAVAAAAAPASVPQALRRSFDFRSSADGVCPVPSRRRMRASTVSLALLTAVRSSGTSGSGAGASGCRHSLSGIPPAVEGGFAGAAPTSGELASAPSVDVFRRYGSGRPSARPLSVFGTRPISGSAEYVTRTPAPGRATLEGVLGAPGVASASAAVRPAAGVAAAARELLAETPPPAAAAVTTTGIAEAEVEPSLLMDTPAGDTATSAADVGGEEGDSRPMSQLLASVTGGGGGGGGEVPTTELRQLLAQAFPAAAPASAATTAVTAAGRCGGSAVPPGCVLLFRGLRVRMGMHCGVSSNEVQYNRASSRTVYAGRTLQLAKAVSDAGRGGQILLSGAVRTALDPKPGGGSDMPYIVLGAGKHMLTEGAPAMELYGIFPRGLLPRAGHMAGLRSLEEQVPGCLSAPLGRVALALALVQDEEEFAGWGLEASLETHRAMLKGAAKLVRRYGGYLLRTPPGSFQAAFPSPRAAMTWLLELQEELGPAPGSASPSLYPQSPAPLSASRNSSGDSDVADVLLRRAILVAQLSTFHLKGGVDVGPLAATLSAGDGEVSYSGGAAKRAACLAASAAWHEVLVSLEAARDVLGEAHPASSAFIAGSADTQARRSRRRRLSTLRTPPTSALCSDSGQIGAACLRATGSATEPGFEPAPGPAPSAALAAPVSSEVVAPSIGPPAAVPPIPPAAVAPALGSPAGPSRPVCNTAPPTPRPTPASNNEAAAPVSTAFAPLAFGSGIRTVKFRGGAIEACTVALADGRME